MLLMQGAPQGVTLAAAPNSHDALIAQGGNTYQLVHAAPVVTAEQAENAQKVSVIMQPSAGVGAPIQYIAQFDGPPPPSRRGRRRSQMELKRAFEEERKKEQAKLEGLLETPSELKCSEMTKLTSGTAEKRMSSEIELYLKVERSRKTKTLAAPPDPDSSGAAAKRKRRLPATKSPNNTDRSTEGVMSDTTSPQVGEKAVASGRNKTKVTKKSVLGKRGSTRQCVRKEGEGPANEEEDPLDTPPRSKQKRKQSVETAGDRTTPVAGEGEIALSDIDGRQGSQTETAAGGGRGHGTGDASTPKLKHACDECGKEYVTRGSLLSHKNTVHGLTPLPSLTVS